MPEGDADRTPCGGPETDRYGKLSGAVDVHVARFFFPCLLRLCRPSESGEHLVHRQLLIPALGGGIDARLQEIHGLEAEIDDPRIGSSLVVANRGEQALQGVAQVG
jgi:hypothetical protein